jgi:quercetin dioxygenase-like cupin family protein
MSHRLPTHVLYSPNQFIIVEELMRSLQALLIVAALPIQVSLAQNPVVKWGPAPAVFPAGAKMAVMQGDPSKAQLFTVRLDLPKGYTIAPHFHPTDEHITVISGNFEVGMGDKVDAKKTMTLTAGGFATAPARAHHYAIAKTHSIVQVHAIGPFQLTYVNAADDPSRKGPAKK